ncbi:E3 ubiquitin-protein ligase trul-1 [Linum grandiflorum]
MFFLSFDFQPNQGTLNQDEFPQSKVLREFVQMQQAESIEAAVSSIVFAFLSVMMKPTDLPATPLLSPLLKCVGDALETNTIPRPLPEYRYRREVKLDVVHSDGVNHTSYRASVEGFFSQQAFPDEGDIADDEVQPWMFYDEDDQEEEEEMSVMEEDEEDETAVDLEGCLKDVTVKFEVDCGVCLDEIPAGNEAEAMVCGHIYHGGCIRKWLRQSKTAAACPLCRFPAAGL